MKPIEFKEQNTVFGEGQKEYLPLPAYVDPDPEGYVITCWRLSIKERLAVLLSGCLWLSQMSFHEPLQPQLIVTSKYEIFNKPGLQRGLLGPSLGLARGYQGASKGL